MIWVKTAYNLSCKPLSGRIITYNVMKTSDGWKIEAQLPKHVSKSDQIKVLDWFRQYRAQVRRSNPTWTAKFEVGTNGYSLEVKPLQGVQHLAGHSEDVKRALDETLKYA